MAAPFLSLRLSKPSLSFSVPEMKSWSRFRDNRASKGLMVYLRSAILRADSASRPLSGSLVNKERNAAERGQKRTDLGGSFINMESAGWTHGAAGMALGAVAAWLGMGTEPASGYLFPVLVGASAVLVGVGLMFRGNRRTAVSGLVSLPSACSLATRQGAEAEAAGSALLGHEMKNYLCTLKGNARLLRNRMPGDDQAIIDRIDRVVEKLESFTRRMGTGEAATGLGALKPVPPAQAAQVCVRTHFHKHLEAFRFCEDSAASALLCDPGRLEQVFLNLFANSLEAGAGRIETSVRSEGRRLIVRIEDDGRGCAPDDLGRIFEPFFTTKTGPARRGLGMFIVQSIVENHGGSVRVVSKNGSPGAGTGLVFTLDFPQPSRGAIGARPVPLVAAMASATEEWMLAPLVPQP